MLFIAESSTHSHPQALPCFVRSSALTTPKQCPWAFILFRLNFVRMKTALQRHKIQFNTCLCFRSGYMWHVFGFAINDWGFPNRNSDFPNRNRSSFQMYLPFATHVYANIRFLIIAYIMFTGTAIQTKLFTFEMRVQVTSRNIQRCENDKILIFQLHSVQYRN